jgi:NitT/TauT family transport system substrate-binding protein
LQSRAYSRITHIVADNFDMKAAKLLLIVVLASIGYAGWRLSQPKIAAPPRRPLVSLRNPIPEISTGQTPLFMAAEKEFYAAEGLQVKFEQGGREVNPVAMVAVGNNDFGMVGGPETLLVGRGKGVPIKAIAVLHRNANFPCFITLKSSGITQLSQLAGKDVGFFPGHITSDVLRPLLKRNQISVNEVNVGFDYNQLITGMLAAQWGFTVRAALELPAKGVDINVLRASDYGIVTHGYTIFALQKTIDERPEVCEKLLRGIFKGIEYTIAHPAEGADLLLKLNPALNRSFIETSEPMFNAVLSHSAEFPMGYMDRSMFENTYGYLKEQGAIEKEFDVRDAYTTIFLERIHGRKFE